MTPPSPSDAAPARDRVQAWFAAQGWAPFPFQHAVWDAYARGQSGLIHAPTGTGKTYAAWLGPVMQALAEDPSPPPAGLRVLWLTPLRALAADTAHALAAPLDALGLRWTVETRTADTASATRSRQARRLPHTLITTPESLSLLLARPDAAAQFVGLRAVVVDEWHELLASKRGTQVELGLARLRAWHPDVRVWGLSATLGNLDEALRALLGVADVATGEVPFGLLVRGELPKALLIDSVLPPRMDRFPWAGHLGLHLLPQVVDAIEEAATTLVFTNTRAQAERWFQALLDARPDWAGLLALHHSSLESATRTWVEDALRAGTLKCVVATSSLDLGVDFPTVDRVLQIASPKGVGRLVQRAGRSGHQPGATSRVTCVPAHAFELVEVAAARAALGAGQVEARVPTIAPLDVLAQHMVTVALGGGFVPDALYREVRTATSYRALPRAAFDAVLAFTAGGGAALAAYPQYRKLDMTTDDGTVRVADDAIARAHRMGIGTIVSDANLTVQYLNGAELGNVPEAFAARLRPGDAFVLAGRLLRFVRIREMTVWVRRASGNKGVVPRWAGGSLPLSSTLADGVRALIDAAGRGVYDGPEMQAVQPILTLQARWSLLPPADTLLIERARTREGHHLFVYPFAGKLANEGLAALTATRLARHLPSTYALTANDYGFELLGDQPPPLDAALADGLFAPGDLAADVLASLNASELARRQFREVARVAGLVSDRFPGGRKTAKQLQASAGLLYDVLARYDPGNLLLVQAQEEVLARQLDLDRLRAALERAQAGRVAVVDVPRPTPLAFPLLFARLEATVTSETLEARVRRLLDGLERAAAKGD